MDQSQGRTRILDYLLLTLALPAIVWMELNEASRDISLAMTGGKYSGYGQLNRGRYRDDDDADPPPDWLRPPNYSRTNFRAAVSRAKQRHYIEKRAGVGGLPELVLTEHGRDRVLKTFPFLKLARRRWQGWWLVVTFDIPEIDKKIRESLRSQLTHIGFVQWQKSVYVSPHDIADDLTKVIRDNHLEDKVVPMIAKRILAGSDWEFARRVFHIDNLEAEYQGIVKALAGGSAAKTDAAGFLRRQFNRYIKILQHDPFLPVGLVPQAGYGREAALKALQTYALEIKSNLKTLFKSV